MTYLEQFQRQLADAETQRRNGPAMAVNMPGRVMPQGANLADYVQQLDAADNTPMRKAIRAGQVTPDELIPRLANTPEMGLTRPTPPPLPGAQPSEQLGLPAGKTPSVGNLNAVPETGRPIPMGPAGSAGPASSLLDQGAVETGALSKAALSTSTAADLAPLVEGAAGPAVAAQAAETVGKGFLGKVNGMFPSLGLNVTGQTLFTGLGVATAGLAAGGFVDSLDIGGQNSNWDQAATGAVKGAGIGAGLAIAAGMAAGPVGWAALGGAALFGIGNAFLSHDSKSDIDQMTEAVAKTNHTVDVLLSNPHFGVDAYTAQQIRSQVAASTAFYMDQKDKAGLNQYLKGLATTVPSFMMEASQKNQVTQAKLQMQAAFGPVYSKMLDRSSQVNQQAFQSQMQAATQIADPSIRGSLQTQAAQQLKNSQDTLTAYTQQMAASTQAVPQAGQPANPAAGPYGQAYTDQVQGMMQQAMAG